MRRAAAAAVVCVAVLAGTTGRASEPPKTARAWAYANLVTMLSPEWGLLTMPGVRYELSRSPGAEKRHYFDELFVGPLFVKKSGPLTFKLGLWYYFMGYPNRATGDFDWSHNLELVPQLDYRVWRLTLTNRVIFHNTFYASVYGSARQKLGWGTVVRELAQATFWVTDGVGVTAADEPFFGVIEDSETKPSSIGYWPHGIGLNRVYAGMVWRIDPAVTLTPQYVYETSYDTKGTLTAINHYLFTTLSWTLKGY